MYIQYLYIALSDNHFYKFSCCKEVKSHVRKCVKNTKNNLSEELYNEIEQAVKNLGDSLPTKRSGKPLSLDSVDQDIKEINFMSQQIGIPTPPEKEES